MKNFILILLCAFALSANCASCKKGGNSGSNSEVSGPDEPVITGNKMKITIGTRTFTATLNNNATANAFKAMLPLSVDMTELNANEKYAELSRSLPANATNPGTIKNGDIMVYGSTTLVLFYKTFQTSYSYTAVGRVDEPAELADALGRGNIRVTFQLEQ